MVKAKTLNFHPSAANEGYWVSSYLEQNLGGIPEENLEAYIQYSPYNYLTDGGPNLESLIRHLPFGPTQNLTCNGGWKREGKIITP